MHTKLTLSDLQSSNIVVWSKIPKHTTLDECRSFAEKHNLKLPAGFPRKHDQRKEAYVALFMLCHEAREHIVNIDKLSWLTQKRRDTLIAYCDKLDTERYVGNSIRKSTKKMNGTSVGKVESCFKVVSSSNTVQATSRSLQKTSSPHLTLVKKTNDSKLKWHETASPELKNRFGTPENWQRHNQRVTSHHSFEIDLLTALKPQTWPARFSSVEEWHAFNAAEKTESKGFNEASLEAALIIANPHVK